MKKLLLAISFAGMLSTAYADPITSLVLPSVAGEVIEKIGDIIEGLSVIGADENKEWAKHMAERRQEIVASYQTSRKDAITTFNSCVGDQPEYEKAMACSESYSKVMLDVKKTQKTEFKSLIEENKKHTQRLARKHEIFNQVNAIVE